jgi:pyoverdine/dityrosine biosynthesis protein Dit1
MRSRRTRWSIRHLFILTALTAACSSDTPWLRTSEARAVSAFKDRVAAYVALHEKLEATLPALPDKATPQQIDQVRKNIPTGIKNTAAD